MNIGVEKYKEEGTYEGEVLCVDDAQGGGDSIYYIGHYRLNSKVYLLTPLTNDGSRDLIAGCGTFHSLHAVGLYHLWINIPYWWFVTSILLIPVALVVEVGSRIINNMKATSD